MTGKLFAGVLAWSLLVESRERFLEVGGSGAEQPLIGVGVHD